MTEEGFWKRVRCGHCLEWTGKKNAYGYGRVTRWKGRDEVMAHHVALELMGINIPEGMEVDHLCKNHACVAFWHLDVVTHAENVRRGDVGKVNKARFAAMTHCPRGHEYTSENTYRSVGPKGHILRHCKTCRAQRSLDHKRRKRESA